jgi:branched-chain amino acid transport system permease protein
MNVALLLFTANYRTVQTPYSDTALYLGPLYVPVAKLIAFGLAMALSGVLWVFLHTTDMGKAMRAAAQKPEVAMLMASIPIACSALPSGFHSHWRVPPVRCSCLSIRRRRWPARYSC